MATAHLPEPSPPHLRPSRFSHLVLKTAQFDAMKSWYKTVLSAYAVETLEDLVNAYLRLKDEGILPHNCINHGFTTSLYFLDPDGNEVELQVDNYKTRDAMDAWFATGAFDRNFAGHVFDPEYMVERHRAGVPEDEILQTDLYR
jgi:catechol-2,3-dioxygenase